MKLTAEMKRRLQERELFEAKVNILLGCKPQMKVLQVGNTTSINTFNLRSLNKNLIKKE